MSVAEELGDALRAAFPDAEVAVRDLTLTGDHFEVRLVSAAFEGKSMRDQHQLVYRALEPLVSRGALHGLGLVTSAPDVSQTDTTEVPISGSVPTP